VFEGLAKIAPFLLASSVMAIGVYYLGLLLETMQAMQLIILLIQVLAGVAIYFGLLIIFYRKPVINMIKDLKGRKDTPLVVSSICNTKIEFYSSLNCVAIPMHKKVTQDKNALNNQRLGVLVFQRVVLMYVSPVSN
jgi:hypothetical protein